jgi:hypothetical protein
VQPSDCNDTCCVDFKQRRQRQRRRYLLKVGVGHFSDAGEAAVEGEEERRAGYKGANLCGDVARNPAQACTQSQGGKRMRKSHSKEEEEEEEEGV